MFSQREKGVLRTFTILFRTTKLAIITTDYLYPYDDMQFAPNSFDDEADGSIEPEETALPRSGVFRKKEDKETSVSKAPVPKVRSEFPETWLWMDEKTG